jgi:putative component of membrane protein insertase Oxa1/YidC/SpoIIIJ protein YidD
MKLLLLLPIKLYWAIWPKSKRRKCIFRTSCSQHVYQVTKKEGLGSGLRALKFRFRNCRSGFHVFANPLDGRRRMILPGGLLLGEEEIAERLLNGFPAVRESFVKRTNK